MRAHFLFGTSALFLAACGPTPEQAVQDNSAMPYENSVVIGNAVTEEASEPAPAPTPVDKAPAAEPAPQITAEKPAAFAQCAICHKVDKSGTHGIGPNLYGVYGEKAGSAAGYVFSPALKAWGATLDDANLNAFIENPHATIPGTKMAYVGLKDAAKRKAIIDWLKTQK
ncbi:c-type cytochrome [Rhizorhapis sp. SPR117]|uniref:c-type cytochrome n=1 Tax=Rhizorhapis sp. SPR117 TaxID=2912611 RepID=UPI001EFF86EA|nr:c-type cytochrome [Rhizorhapis sp. SPR117]